MRLCILPVLCFSMVSFSILAAHENDNATVIFELSYELECRGDGTWNRVRDLSEPNKVPFTLFYTSAADFENAKKLAPANNGNPEDFAKWKQVITKPIVALRGLLFPHHQEKAVGLKSSDRRGSKKTVKSKEPVVNRVEGRANNRTKPRTTRRIEHAMDNSVYDVSSDDVVPGVTSRGTLYPRSSKPGSAMSPLSFHSTFARPRSAVVPCS